MRTKRFMAVMKVTEQLLVAAPRGLVEDEVRRGLDAELSDLRGPRGGRYVPVGPVAYSGPAIADEGDFMRNTRTCTAAVVGRYVRPKS